jgi:uncharacterized integral membrane protein
MTDQGQYYQPQNPPPGPPGNNNPQFGPPPTGGPSTGGPTDAPSTGGPTGGPSTGSPGRTKRPVSVGQILGGLLFVLVIIFIIENSRKVKIRLIIPEVKAPLYVAILIAAVLGSGITWLLRYRRHRHHPPRR